MSCYLVTQKEIFLVAALAIRKKHSFPELHTDQFLTWKWAVQDLMTANVESVNTRYKETTKWEPDFTLWLMDDGKIDEWDLIDECLVMMKKLTVVQKLKILDHYSYQSCDWEVWNISEANKLVQRARSLLIEDLTGYEDAAWGLEEC